jgi:hypothetical protein
MRCLKVSILSLVSLAFVVACAPADIKFQKKDLQAAPLYEIKDLICGGGRTYGKHLVIGGNSCTMPSSSDETCDQWGCSIVKNSDGDLDCPAGTVRRVTDTTPVEYFICIIPEDSPTKAFKVAGGTRMVGKYESPEECTAPASSDQSCNRFGNAIVTNSSTGDSGCPSGSTVARISDNWTSILCLN